MKNKTILEYSFVDIDGKQRELSEFAGKYLLIVNVASACGFTPQYQQLQELFEHFREKLNIVAFPCNDFGGQEPGNEEEIKTFCITRYNTGFTLASKINIKKNPIHPIYEWLCSKALNGVKDSSVDWNFQKYLLDEKGQLIDVFKTTISPLDDQIISRLQAIPE